MIPKMYLYFRFSRHRVDISGRDVTEPYAAINSVRSPGQCPHRFIPICRDKG